MWFNILVLFTIIIVNEPVINPDNVKPGDWFTPIDTVEQQCTIYYERTGLVCDAHTN